MTAPSTRRRWLGPLVGLAALASVIALVLGRGDFTSFVEIIRGADPWWIALAVVFQACTYLTVAAGWWLTLARSGSPRPLSRLYALALVVLFTNQALPVAGIAGIAVVIDVLGRDGLARPVALAAVVIDEIGYLASFGLGIGSALAMLAWWGEVPTPLLGAAGLALGAGMAMGVGIMVVTAPHRERPRWVGRWGWTRKLYDLVTDADPALVRDPRLPLAAIGLRFGNFALDALTFWACLRAVGEAPALHHAWVAFVAASLGRSLGLVPGGLGTFEGGAIGALALVHIPLEAGLAAALLFRVLSYWLPMIPGLWLARRL